MHFPLFPVEGLPKTCSVNLGDQLEWMRFAEGSCEVHVSANKGRGLIGHAGPCGQLTTKFRAVPRSALCATPNSGLGAGTIPRPPTLSPKFPKSARNPGGEGTGKPGLEAATRAIQPDFVVPTPAGLSRVKHRT